MLYFNCENYSSLEETIKRIAASGDADALEDLSYLKKAVLSFFEYVYRVGEEQIETRYAKGIQKGDELKETISHFDMTRHVAHETAIVNANMVNRIADAYKVGAIFTGDSSNRREVGHFCGELCNWFFVNRYN